METNKNILIYTRRILYNYIQSIDLIELNLTWEYQDPRGSNTGIDQNPLLGSKTGIQTGSITGIQKDPAL